MDEKYYAARPTDTGGWVGVIYHFDKTGNKEIRDWTSEQVAKKEAAEDECCRYAEVQGWDITLE